MSFPKLDVLLSPVEFELLPGRDLSATCCVVFDVLRATSTMTVALANGATGILPCGTIDEAVADGAVVPLLYEGRLVEQQVSGTVIDRWFEKISEGLTDSQKADLKRKFSQMDALAKTDQGIRAKAFDISEHYRQHWH